MAPSPALPPRHPPAAYSDLVDVLVRDKVLGTAADLALRMSLIPLKMLVPNVAVGRLIGRGGFNVKRLMAETDSYIICSRDEQVSPHAQPSERVLTVMASPVNQVRDGASARPAPSPLSPSPRRKKKKKGGGADGRHLTSFARAVAAGTRVRLPDQGAALDLALAGDHP